MSAQNGSQNGAPNGAASGGDGFAGAAVTAGQPEITGRYLVLFREGETDSAVQVLSDQLGMRAVRSSQFLAEGVAADALANENIIFDSLGVAVVNAPPDQMAPLSALAAEDSNILAVEPERIVYALEEVSLRRMQQLREAPLAMSPALTDYLHGYYAAVSHLVDDLASEKSTVSTEIAIQGTIVEDKFTWGLQLTNIPSTRFTGKGIRVAVLDTGFDFGHPDFVGRKIMAKSFINGQTPDDGHGHGTHCVGVACGPAHPTQLPRYGIASDAEIYVGKVLSNAGSGADGGILAGIDWAITNKCAVVSMSLGAATSVGQPYSAVYEAIARRALAAGTLIVAAAGNESNRPGTIAPVGHPANCPSIMAVAAVDVNMATAFFSCGGRNPDGGQVDIAGPGVAVRSSWPRPTLYRSISGTSMATPHVAGIAALYGEANPGMRGGSLGWLLLQSARRIGLPTLDVGAGLVQAP